MTQIAGKRQLVPALVAFFALAGCAGDAGEEGAVEEPLEQRRHVAPPDRIEDDPAFAPAEIGLRSFSSGCTRR